MTKILLVMAVIVGMVAVYYNLHTSEVDFEKVNQQMVEYCSQYLLENPDGMCD